MITVHFRFTSGHFYFRLLYTGWDGIFSVCVSFNESKGVHHLMEECKNARKKVHEISRIHSSVLKKSSAQNYIWRLILIGQHLYYRSLVPITNHVACPYLVLESFVFLVPDWLIFLITMSHSVATTLKWGLYPLQLNTLHCHKVNLSQSLSQTR